MTRVGLHCSPAGYEIVFQEVMKVIESQWPDQMPENLPMVFPYWKDQEAWQEWESAHASSEGC